VAIAVDELASTGGVSQIQDSPHGASELGSFAWPELPELLREGLKKWSQKPEKVPPKELGELLFKHVFAGKPGETLRAALTETQADERVLVGVSSASATLHSLPFEILHDGKSYLSSGNRIVFRHVNDGVDVEPKTHGFTRFLFVVAEPKAPGYAAFDHDKFVWAVKSSFEGAVVKPVIVPNATRDAMAHALAAATEAFDAVFIIAHGKASGSKDDGAIVLERDDEGPDLWSASSVTQALARHKGCVVVLCSCSSASVDVENPFAGIAQHLMATGPVAGVIAMQRPVTIPTGLAFIKQLAKQLREPANDIFSAFAKTTALVGQAGWEHGVPCFYTRLPRRFAGGQGLLTSISRPADDELLRLATLFSANQQTSRFAFSLPQFRQSIPVAEFAGAAAKTARPAEGYFFPGLTVAAHDLGAVEHLLALVGRFVPGEDLWRRIAIVSDHAVGEMLEHGDYTHYFLLGSRSHSFSRSKLRNYSRDFDFDFSAKSEWRLCDRREGVTYTVPNPQEASTPTPGERDYALLEKIIDPLNRRVVFVIAGMWDTSTHAAGRYLLANRDRIVGRFGSGGFQIILETVQGSLDIKTVVCERAPRISGS
jgi:hypothetical protein